MSIEQLSFLRPTIWTVIEITRYIRNLFESDTTLQDVWVRGEVSNFSRPRSGHIYFTIKDEHASLRCVMWRSVALTQTFLPKDGDAVEVHGAITVYEAGGQYQMYADEIQPLGKGALYEEFLRLKAQLQAEGLFDEGKKRPIPAWPKKIGIVTSATGAALRDILNTIKRRYPLVEVILSPTPVQGNDAPPGIVTAIKALNELVEPDIILVARGGGSIEDLWAFNDPQVAYAIAASKAPVITGIGHQTDFTIADFVADLRAPTPTAAAELATPDRSDLKLSLLELEQQLTKAVLATIEDERWELQTLYHKLERTSPLRQIQSSRQRLDEYINRMNASLFHSLQVRKTRLKGHNQQLMSLNPVAILNRGYAIVSKESGEIIRSPKQVKHNDLLNIHVAEGKFEARASTPNVKTDQTPDNQEV